MLVQLQVAYTHILFAKLQHDVLFVFDRSLVITELLQGGNASRTFYTQMLLTGVDAAAVKQSKQEEEEEASDGLGSQGDDDQPGGSQVENPAKKMRVDSTQRTGAIEAYISTGRESGGGGRGSDAARIAAGGRPSAAAAGGADERGGYAMAPFAPARMRKVAPPQLDSIRALLKAVSVASHAELYGVLRGHVYVGSVDNGRHLLQHQTQLYMVDTTAVCEELFYQEALRRFGQVEGKIMLSKPLPLLPLVAEGLRLRAAAGLAPAASPSKGGGVEAEAGELVDLLVGKQEMIDEYYAIGLGSAAEDGVEGAAVLRTLLRAMQIQPESFNLPLFLDLLVTFMLPGVGTLPVLVEQYEPHWG